MPATEEEVALADFQKTLNELEERVVVRATRSVLQKTASGRFTGSGGSGAPAPIETGHGRTILLADESKMRDFLSQPKSWRSSTAFDCRVERKAIVSGISPSLYLGGVRGPQQPALRLNELLPHLTITGGGSVTFTQETAFTPGGDLVVETALKPPSALTFANITVPFATVATVLKSSVQALNDTPTLQQWVATRLFYAVELRQENYLLNDATAGLLTNAQVLDPAYAPAAGGTQLDLVGAAIGQLTSAGYTPDGVVMNGLDVNKTRLLKSTLGEYLWSSPDSSLGTTSMWSCPVCISPSMAPGEFLVGAFAQSTILFDRDVLRLDISFENEDDFIHNLACLRAELRAALAVPAPQGLIRGSFAAGATTTKASAPPASK